jgi:arylsulfate sulfotransferase
MRTLRIAAFAAWSAFAMFLFPVMGRAESTNCTISLTPSTPSPQLVGELVVWTTTATGCGDAPVYQYKVAFTSANPKFRMARDFSLANTLAWGPLQEGSYAVMVTVKGSFDAGDSTSAVVSDEIHSLVTGGQAVITPTLNPLVALYSAPPCDDGSIYVKFRPVSDTNDLPWKATNTLTCAHGLSRNFLVAGMLANTPYEMAHVTSDGSLSPSLFFTTGTPPPSLDFPSFVVRRPPGRNSDLSQDMIYHNFTGRPQPNAVNLVATDLLGQVEWYSDPLQSGLSNGAPGVLEPEGTILFLGRDSHRKLGFNVLREIDLAGNPLRETNIDAVNAQLSAKGQGIIYGFHHEVLRLPNGNIATLGWNLRTVDISGTPTPYAGQLLMVLDQDFQVLWTWDAFDHLDVHRGPILGDVCTGAPCPIRGAVDWLHANSVAWSAEDSNLLISLRHQAWEIKIDYNRGAGDGHIIWRLGKDGDFAVTSTDPSPWFSYQHNVHYLDKKTLLLFDNGNVRCDGIQKCHSRGQTWTIDEKAMMATQRLNVDLGNFSGALGSAERLPNGNFVFTSGFLGTNNSGFGLSMEVSGDGTKQYVMQGGAIEYRSYRMAGLYDGIRK